MNKHDLADLIAKKTDLSNRQAENLIDSFTGAIEKALENGEKVVYSNFGTFYTVHYPSKVIYHPVLGKEKKMVMLPTDAVKWMPSNNVKSLVCAGLSVDSATKFGAKKELSKIIKDKGLIAKKSTEIEEPMSTPIPDQPEEEEEEYEIPIRNLSKNKTKVSLMGTGIFGNGSSPAPDQSKPEPAQENIDGQKEETENPPKEDKEDKKVETPGFEFIGQTEPLPAPQTAEEKTELPEQETAKDGKNEKSQGDENKDEEKKDEIVDFESDTLPLMSPKNNISYIDLSKVTVPKELLQKVPEKIAREYGLVPVEETEKELVLAMIDPEDVEAIEMIRKIVQKVISPRLTTESDINHILDQYQGFESEVQTAIDESSDEETKDKQENDDKSKETLIAEASDTAPAARIVGSLLKRAIRDKASDIHIEPNDNEVIVRFRLDGVLHKKVSLPKDIQSAVISRIKILSNLKIDEQRLPQDGRFSIKLDNRRIDFRVSTMPIANGEKVVMRVLDKLTGIKTIDDLGFRERDFQTIIANIEKSHGMLLVTGPTGSGKTTTLYALIDKIYCEGINIITLEDPIEYQMPGINQSQVNADIDYTFASGLRSILRQDPDVVMIGEIRDGETAEMAVHAALTGHVVLSTLHTNDSAGAIPRLLDMNLEPFLLNSSLNMVIAQRLARKLCDSCKVETTLSANEMKSIEQEIAKMPEEEQKKINKSKLKFYKNKGCKNCSDTGYRGRIGLYEVLEVNGKIKEMIGAKTPSQVIREEAIKNGMTTMIQDGIMKALDGITTIEEVWRVTKE